MDIPKRKAKILHEIAEALKEWGKYNQKDADEATRRSPDARQKTKSAMELLLDNMGLLYEVRQKYGCHQPLQKLFDWLGDVASKRDKRDTDLGAYWCWGRDFTQPQLWAGNNSSFIDECLRWASLERVAASGGNAGDTATKANKQPWRDDDPDYMDNSTAITTFTSSKMPLSTLSKMLREPNNKLRWMTKGQRSKVHIGDFKKYAEGRYRTDAETAEIADEFLADIESRKAKEDLRKSKNK